MVWIRWPLAGSAVTKVDGETVYLQDGRAFKYGMCVWSTGVAPRKVTSLLDAGVFAKDKGGRLRTDPTLRVLSAASSGTGAGE